MSPDFVEDFIGREDAGGARSKFFKKLHLAVRQDDWLFVRQEDARLSVQSEAADSYAAMSFGGQAEIALTAAKMRMQARQKQRDWSLLDDVVIGASIERSGL